MERQTFFRPHVIGIFLGPLLGLLCASCAMAQAANVITEIKLNVNACSASFVSTTCRGGKVPNGDLCIGKGPGTQPIMIFKFEPPFPAAAKIKQMDISLNSDGSCPADVADDFPAFSSPSCSYAPNPAGNTLQIQNNNKNERVWFYTLTLEIPGCMGDIVIHPVIENGGNN